MSPTEAGGRRVTTAINRAALVLSLALFVAIGTLWWRDRTRLHEVPRWDESGAVELRGERPGDRERWIVAVNPECPHCMTRLAALRAAIGRQREGRSLGVLLVDVPHRPDSLVAGEDLAAGVWWDSAGAWRRRWGRHAYGEVLVFSPGGSLRRILPPDSTAAPR